MHHTYICAQANIFSIHAQTLIIQYMHAKQANIRNYITETSVACSSVSSCTWPWKLAGCSRLARENWLSRNQRGCWWKTGKGFWEETETDGWEERDMQAQRGRDRVRYCRNEIWMWKSVRGVGEDVRSQACQESQRQKSNKTDGGNRTGGDRYPLTLNSCGNTHL